SVDLDGNETTLGNSVSVVTSSGNQTVNCSLPSLPNGAKGFNVYRNAFRIVVGGVCTSPQVSGSSFTDAGTGCGNGAPQLSSAGSSFLSKNGVSTYQLRLGGRSLNGTTGNGNLIATGRGGFSQGHLGTFDANDNLADAGVAPPAVSDFFNRSSGDL